MLNIALIGLGVMGRNHYRVLKTLHNVKLVGLCDPFVLNGYEEPCFSSVDELLDQVKIDAAIVAVPTFLHREVAFKCMERGIHLLIEKPLALTFEEGRDILNMASEKQLRVMVGHIERFNPVVQALKNEIQGKEIYSISITRVGPFPPRVADVGILTDLAVHDIDLIRFITGREIIKKSIYKTHKRHHQHEDNAILTFELEDKVIGAIITNWLTPFKKRRISVAASDAYYEADLMSQDLTEYSHFQINNSFVTRKCPVNKGEPLVNELNGFVTYITTGNRNMAASVEDGLATLRIIQTI